MEFLTRNDAIEAAKQAATQLAGIMGGKHLDIEKTRTMCADAQDMLAAILADDDALLAQDRAVLPPVLVESIDPIFIQMQLLSTIELACDTKTRIRTVAQALDKVAGTMSLAGLDEDTASALRRSQNRIASLLARISDGMKVLYELMLLSNADKLLDAFVSRNAEELGNAVLAQLNIADHARGIAALYAMVHFRVASMKLNDFENQQ
jgi:hypothetical protein